MFPRQAIRTYDSGGVAGDLLFNLPGRAALPDPGAVTPQVTQSPQQPSPQATGTPTPLPPQAVNTAPAAPAQQAPDFDDDRDLEASNTAEANAFKNLQSHRGDHRFLNGSMPEEKKVEDHPSYPDYQEAASIVATLDPKTQKAYRARVDKMLTRIQKETDSANKGAKADFIRTETQALRKADATGTDVLRIPDLDTHVGNGYGAVAKQFEDASKNAADAGARQKAEQRVAASPLKTMEPEQQLAAARGILALNKDMNMSPSDAARIVVQLGTPPPRGTRGLNGLTGRGAANYVPTGVDALGNRLVKTEMGTIRLPPDTYTQIKNARMKGYGAALDYQKKLQEQRDEEAKPGVIGRAIDWGAKQLQ